MLSDQMCAMPRAMLSIASVVTNDGMRNRSAVQPFHQPMTSPRPKTRSMVCSAGNHGQLDVSQQRIGSSQERINSNPVVVAVSATTEPTDRSIPRPK